MSKMALWGVAAAITILILSALLGYRPGSRKQSPGTGTNSSLAPDFSLTDLNEKTVRLSDYRGQVVLLDFWATWCGPCEKEIPEFVQMQDKYRNLGFQVIGISMDDSPKPVRNFYERFRLNYPVAMGDAKVAQLYGGVYGLPVTFVIGRDGSITAKFKGAADLVVLHNKIESEIKAAQ